MHKYTTLALATLVTGALLVPATASAVHDQGPSFTVGSSFHIGGVSVSLVYGSRGTQWAPAYYYRVPVAIGYRGVSCTSSCFVDTGYHYHSPSCPVASYYFRNHRFDSAQFWAPRPRTVYVRPPVYRVYSPPPPVRYYSPPSVRYYSPPSYVRYGHVPPGHMKHHGRGHGWGHYKHDKHDRHGRSGRH